MIDWWHRIRFQTIKESKNTHKEYKDYKNLWVNLHHNIQKMMIMNNHYFQLTSFFSGLGSLATEKYLEAMGQNPEKVAKAYDSVAMEYAEKFCGEHEKKPQDREILFRFSQAVAGKKPIWDFGCGPGQTTRYLRNLGVEISGLDLSEKLIEQANMIHPGITFRKGNILDLEFKNESIAGIVAFYAIVHFSPGQLKKAFREIFRVLQPGGVFLFTYHIGEEVIHLDEFLGQVVEMDFMFFKTDFILICIKDAGFYDIEIIERDPYPEVEYQSRRAYVFAKKPTVNREP